jgi:hypothetical protein
MCAVISTRAAAQQDSTIRPLSGRVRSIEGYPIVDAEVTVEGSRRVVRTDSKGGFIVPGVAKGVHEIAVRHIGYLPAVAASPVPQIVDTITIVMVTSRPELDTVKVTAQVIVLAGIVVDEHFRPLPGASVDLLGSRRSAITTGPDGWFTFPSIRSGPTIISVTRPGYVHAVQSVRLQDSRGVVVHMDRIDTTLSPGKQANLSGLGNMAKQIWFETQQRLDRRNVNTIVVTSEDLDPVRDLTLGEAITHAPSAVNILTELHRSHNTPCVLLNGNQMVGQVSLDTYDAEDVEFVELYPSGSPPPRSVAAHMQIAGCSRGVDGGTFYAVVWMRN